MIHYVSNYKSQQLTLIPGISWLRSFYQTRTSSFGYEISGNRLREEKSVNKNETAFFKQMVEGYFSCGFACQEVAA